MTTIMLHLSEAGVCLGTLESLTRWRSLAADVAFFPECRHLWLRKPGPSPRQGRASLCELSMNSASQAGTEPPKFELVP